MQSYGLVALIAFSVPGAALAQAQPSAQQSTSVTTQQTPTQTQTTTTRSTTTAVPGTAATPAQTQTTTTRSTATTPTDSTTGAPVGPTQSSTTTATTTTSADAPRAATSADVKSGVLVYDQNGGMVGKVESVNAKGAIVSTGAARATIPVSSFAKNDKGLILSMTKAELDASAKKKTAAKPK